MLKTLWSTRLKYKMTILTLLIIFWLFLYLKKQQQNNKKKQTNKQTKKKKKLFTGASRNVPTKLGSNGHGGFREQDWKQTYPISKDTFQAFVTFLYFWSTIKDNFFADNLMNIPIKSSRFDTFQVFVIVLYYSHWDMDIS